MSPCILSLRSSFSTDDYRFKQLAKLTQCSFEILSTNLDENHLTDSFKECRVFCLGEDHSSEFDRLLISAFIHRLWVDLITALRLETPPQIGQGQLQFIHPAIAVQGKSWDIPEILKLLTSSPSVLSKLGVTFLVRRMILLEEVYDPRLFCEKFESLLSLIPIDIHAMELFHSLKEAMKSSSKPSQYPINQQAKLVAVVYFLAMRALLLKSFFIKSRETILAVQQRLDASFQKELNARDRLFIQNTLEDLKSHKRVITISGVRHVTKDDPLIKKLEEMQIPYIALTSKDTARVLKRMEQLDLSDVDTLALQKMRQFILDFPNSKSDFSEFPLLGALDIALCVVNHQIKSVDSFFSPTDSIESRR